MIAQQCSRIPRLRDLYCALDVFFAFIISFNVDDYFSSIIALKGKIWYSRPTVHLDIRLFGHGVERKSWCHVHLFNKKTRDKHVVKFGQTDVCVARNLISPDKDASDRHFKEILLNALNIFVYFGCIACGRLKCKFKNFSKVIHGDSLQICIMNIFKIFVKFMKTYILWILKQVKIPLISTKMVMIMYFDTSPLFCRFC